MIKTGGDQRSATFIRPAVKWAGEVFRLARIGAAQLGTPVAATIQQYTYLATVFTHNDNRRTAELPHHIITRRRDLAVMGEIDPGAIKNPRHLLAVNVITGKGITADHAPFHIDPATAAVSVTPHGTGHHLSGSSQMLAHKTGEGLNDFCLIGLPLIEWDKRHILVFDG